MKKIFFILLFSLTACVSQSQVLFLIRPGKGDVWPAYSVQRISWTGNNVDNIKISCSLDSGRTWSTLLSSYPASATYYDWTVPFKVSDSCFIRISNVLDSTVSSTNFKDAPFKIPPPGITIDSLPAGVFGGASIPITWTSSGIKKVNLFISYTNGASYVKIADTINANNFYYNWLVKDTIASNCSIKIEDANQSSLSSVTQPAFSIVKLVKTDLSKYKGGYYDGHSVSNNKTRKIIIKSLNSADSLFGNTVYPIFWQQNNTDRVNIYFSADKGNQWQLVSKDVAAGAMKYDWIVSNTPTVSGMIKVVDADDSSNFDTNDVAFVIKSKLLKLVTPDSTSNIYQNTAVLIGWNSGGVSAVKIKLLTGIKDSTLIDSVAANNESINWTIKPGTKDSIRIVIIDKSDSSLRDTSSLILLKNLPNASVSKYHGGRFDGHTMSANTKPFIQTLYPNGKEALSVLKNILIQWKASNLEKLGIYFSSDSGKNWVLIADSIAASANSYVWKSPNVPSQNCLIKLKSVADAAIFDQSDSVFSLAPKKLANTTDSANWIRGAAKSIEWTPSGVELIKISYKLSAAGKWMLLKDSVIASNEILNWVIPATIGDSIWIKMVDVSDSTVGDSTGYFKKIQSLVQSYSNVKYHGGSFDGHTQRTNINRIVIKRPEANEVLTGGAQYKIYWYTINLEDTVQLQYSIDSGKNWINIAKV